MIKKLSEKFRLRMGLLLSATLFLSLFFNACKEEGELVPEFTSGNLNFKDTIIRITSTTVRGDSVLTQATSRNVLGKLNDKVFGLSTGEIYSQFYMTSSTLDIPDAVTFDSVVLYLAYDNFYGFPYEQEVLVYELDEDLDDEIDYYSNASATIKSDLLGSAKLTVNAEDTFFGDSTYVLKVKLSNGLADRLKEQGSFANQAAWLEFFKGLKIMTDPNVIPGDAGNGEGALLYFNMSSSKTKLSFYYNEGQSSEDFKVESKAIRFSHYENVYSADLEASLDKEGDANTYLAALSGCRTKFTFSGISDLAVNGPISVNKAELFLPYDQDFAVDYSPLDRLVIILEGADGQWILPDDYTKSGSSFFGGYVDKTNAHYTFNLASTLNDIINKGNFDQELYLSASGSAVSANRVKVNSGDHPDKELYLILSYTKSK